ncbi:lipopolysaccharide biosynthesis protein [Haloparvum alkalitolerans]|uniref:oligosaccharide flippase family protein n=1 Tax=Haloparvum alkalitolerans TaxID=1042953 RepID=UPI003CEFD6C9
MTDSDAGRESILLFGIQMAARVVGFLGLIYFTKEIPPSELGVYFLFFLVIQVSSMLGNMGLGQALVRRIGEGERQSELFTVTITVVTVVTLIATVTFYALREPLAGYIGADVPGLLALGTGTWLLADLLISTLQAEDRVLTGGLLQLLQDIVRVGIGAVLLTIGYGPVGLMYGVIAGFVATVIIGFPISDLSFAVPEGADFSRVFSISRYTMFFGPTNLIYFWLDTFLIGVLLTRGDVSAYEVAWQTTRVLVIATSAINTTIFPKVSRWASRGEHGEIERVIPGAVLFGLFFPLPGTIGIFVLGEEILGTIYDPNYTIAAIPMLVLSGYMVVESIQRIGNSLLTGMDRADIPFRSRLVGVTLALALNITLIPRYGLVGAAVATLVAKLIDTAYQWIFIERLLDIDYPTRSLLWQIGSAVGMGVIVATIVTALGPLSTVTLLLTILIGAGVYGGLVLFDPEIRQIVNQYLPVTLPA